MQEAPASLQAWVTEEGTEVSSWYTGRGTPAGDRTCGTPARTAGLLMSSSVLPSAGRNESRWRWTPSFTSSSSRLSTNELFSSAAMSIALKLDSVAPELYVPRVSSVALKGVRLVERLQGCWLC